MISEITIQANAPHPLEVNKLTMCPEEENTAEFNDMRFIKVKGFETTEYDVQRDNIVQKIIRRDTPYGWTYDDNEEIKKRFELNLWTRPTIPWSLECEHRGDTRQQAYDNYRI